MVYIKEVWSTPTPVVPGAGVTSAVKPALCEYNERAFLAWATQSDGSSSSRASTFSFTSRLLTGDGWHAPKLVSFPQNTMYQSYTSALAVFKKVLYAFVPFAGTDSPGLAIFSYNGETFVYVGQWGDTWATDVAAAVCDGVLHVIGARQSDNQLFWTYSLKDTHTITGPSGFSSDIKVNQTTSSAPALTVRGSTVVALLLATSEGRGIQECSLTMGADPPWKLTDPLDQSGNSGVSAMTSPDNKNSWICFKKYNGSSNLVCHYKPKDGSYTDNYSMGGSEPWTCNNEAALCWVDNHVYAVWNTKYDGSPLYYSYTPMAVAPSVLRTGSRGTGYIPDKPSPTDPVVNMSAMNMVAAARSQLNMSNLAWVMDQGKIGSCVANAVAAAYRYELRRQGKQDFMPSRLYLYYVSRLGLLQKPTSLPDGSFDTAGFYYGLASQPPTDDLVMDSGSNIREAVKVLSCLGAVSEDSWLYNYEVAKGVKDQFKPMTLASYPPQNGCFGLAKKQFTVRYSLTEGTEQCWKACLGMEYPIVFAFDFYPTIDTFFDEAWNNSKDEDLIAPLPGATEQSTSGHAVLAVGWNDNVPNKQGGVTGCFLVQNSWGSGWGQNGFFWMPYTWLTSNVVLTEFGLTLMDSQEP